MTSQEGTKRCATESARTRRLISLAFATPFAKSNRAATLCNHLCPQINRRRFRFYFSRARESLLCCICGLDGIAAWKFPRGQRSAKWTLMRFYSFVRAFRIFNTDPDKKLLMCSWREVRKLPSRIYDNYTSLRTRAFCELWSTLHELCMIIFRFANTKLKYLKNDIINSTCILTRKLRKRLINVTLTCFVLWNIQADRSWSMNYFLIFITYRLYDRLWGSSSRIYVKGLIRQSFFTV